MLNKFFVVSLAVLSIGLTGCASIVSGANQSVSVDTGEVDGATCELQNDKGKWYVNKTPGSTVVHRSYKKLKVDCKKSGYKMTTKEINSKTKAMAFGNVLFGGGIGAGVDIATGSAYDYPTNISLPMQKAYA